MRLLVLTQYYPPEVGATQTRLHCFASWLAARGHHVTVLAEVPNHPRGIVFQGYRGRLFARSFEDGCEIIRVWVYTSPRKTLWRRLLFYASYMLGAALAGMLLVRGRYDAVFASSPPLPVALSGYVLACAKKCSFIMDVRDIWPAVGVVLGEIRGRPLVRLAERIERFLYTHAAALTCVTQAFVNDAIQKGARRERVHFVPNGTLPEVFSPARVDPGLRSRLGLSGKFVIGFCGNHGVAQGLPQVLEAARLLKRHEQLRFLFVGEGPVKPALRQIKERDTLDNVLLLPEVPLEEVPRYINAADVMLVPLRADPLFASFIPSKMFDFMACEKPILLLVDGEARAILDAAEAGMYVKPDDPHALAAAILALWEKPALRADMGKRGRRYVLQNYVRDRQAEQLETILAGEVSARKAANRRSLPRTLN